MGLLRHAKQLVEELYPYAANFLGRGAMKAADAIQKLGVPAKFAEQLLDTTLKNIPSSGKLALDMYGEFRNNSGIGFVQGAPPVGGIRQNIEYPGYFTRTGYSSLGGGFGKGSKHPQEIFEYGEAFPGDPAMEPARKIREGMARGDHIYEREKPSVSAPTRAAPPVPKTTTDKIRKGMARGDHIYEREKPSVKAPTRAAPSSAAITTKVPSKPPKSIKKMMEEPTKKKKKQKMIPAI